jgi:hypothetical protein
MVEGKIYHNRLSWIPLRKMNPKAEIQLNQEALTLSNHILSYASEKSR